MEKADKSDPKNEAAPHCQHFVMRKKRFCRMTIRAGAKYCGEHEEEEMTAPQQETSDESRKRMPCPFDPKHTCFVSKLSKHLKICNARQSEQPAYIVKSCNWCIKPNLENDSVKEQDRYTTLSSVPIEKLEAVMKKVNELYNCNIKDYRNSKPHEVVKSEIENEERGNNTKKHLIQNSALLHLLEGTDMIKEHTCFVELGAGKGHLSYFLSKAVSNDKTSSVVLVDKQSHRHKQDNKIDKDTHTIDRIRADICDLYLPKLNVVNEAKHLVAVSKHLCGMATDLALRCVTNDEIISKTKGIVMATCCHHRCDYDAYVGQEFIKEHNISAETFSILAGLVSWATCGTGYSRERQNELNPKRIKIDEDDREISANFRKNKLGLGLSERTEVGRKAKALLDWGRLEYLRQKSFESNFGYYVDASVSPENVCIIATKKDVI